MNRLIALIAAVSSLAAHVLAQNFQHSCYSEFRPHIRLTHGRDRTEFPTTRTYTDHHGKPKESEKPGLTLPRLLPRQRRSRWDRRARPRGLLLRGPRRARKRGLAGLHQAEARGMLQKCQRRAQGVWGRRGAVGQPERDVRGRQLRHHEGFVGWGGHDVPVPE
jgi:hypothetical protein